MHSCLSMKVLGAGALALGFYLLWQVAFALTALRCAPAWRVPGIALVLALNAALGAGLFLTGAGLCGARRRGPERGEK